MSVKWSFSGQCKEKATNTAAIPVLIRLGAHPPDGRLRLAFQCPTWGWEVLAFATHAKGLTGFIFLFLQRPRLGRSVKQLVNLVGELHQQGVQFKSLTDAIDTMTPSGRFFFHVMASLAEMERELIGVVSEFGK